MNPKYQNRTSYRMVTEEERSMQNPNHTELSFYLSIFANVGMLALSLIHWNDTDAFGYRWGRFALFMSVLGWVGLYGGMMINDELAFIPKFKENDVKTSGAVALVIFIASLGYQILISKLGYSISPFEQLSYSLFAAPIEENFFRYFILNIIQGQSESPLAKFSAVLVSSILFAAIHQNYWDEIGKMLAVIGGGLIFGVMYIYKKDITGNILGHFAINFFANLDKVGKVLNR